MPQPDPISGLELPVYNDAPAIPDHLAGLHVFHRDRGIQRFGSVAQRDHLVPAPADGMRCVTGTGAALREWIGQGGKWTSIPTVRSRYPGVTISAGSKSGLSNAVIAPSTIPAAPLGQDVPYQVRADASLLVQIPAGGTAALYIAIDDITFAGDYNENRGTAGAFYTLRCGNVAYTTGTAMNAARIITVRLAVPAGTVTTARNTAGTDFVNIEVRPYADL